MEIKSLQSEIKSLIKKLGITQKKASEILLYAKSDDEVKISEDEIKLFYDAFKKQLKRSSTSSATLEEYLSILTLDERGKKLNLVMPVKPKEYVFDAQFRKKMEKISSNIEHRIITEMDEVVDN